MQFLKSVRKKDIIILILLTIILLFLDQLTKYLTDTKLDVSESVPFIDGFMRFTYVRNEGASFGMLQGQKILFVAVTCIILPIMIFFYLKISVIMNIGKDVINKRHFIMFNSSLLLIFIGAIGNFIDRLRFSYVIDFLDVEFIDFPVFNVADCYVTVGTALMFITIFTMKEKELDLILKSRKKWDF